MTGPQFTSEITVELIQQIGGDAMVAAAARVSTGGDLRESDPERDAGLIGYLMRNRHGCYDDATEVLTAEGWRRWPEVDGTESFATLNLATDEIEYQRAERLIRKPVDGPMIRIRMNHIDALVTPDHRMVAAPRVHSGEWSYGLHEAREFLDRSYRIRLGGGTWQGGTLRDPEMAALIGFVAADGNYNNGTIAFRLRKPRKIDWLRTRVSLIETGEDTYRIEAPSERLQQLAKQTYTPAGDRCFPRELLTEGDLATLEALLEGYLQGDGSVTALGKITCSTVSRQLADDIQDLAMKTGRAATETAPDIERNGAFGNRPLLRLTVYRDRNLQAKVGWTTEARTRQVEVVQYAGAVHCVTVPNGTLYVRRNGKPMWCGNSPFEHGAATFRVTAPVVTWWEHVRHRIGWSYNLESGRYKQLDGIFYIPGHARVQTGKPGHYRITDAPELDEEMKASFLRCAEVQWGEYRRMLDLGFANEVARLVLPFNIYYSGYTTANPRSIMAFMSLRTEDDDARYPSRPQKEVRLVGEQYEDLFRKSWPATYDAWVAAGRVAP